MHMETTILLSKVLGLFLVIAGFSIMVRKHYFAPVIGGFVEERLMRMLIGILELIAGLFLAVQHMDFSSLPATIISVLGIALVVEGTAYLLMPDHMVKKIIRFYNVPMWYHAGGAFSVLLGAYLVFFGFGLI
jgi:uncharacterized membrane protein HdeD (DUF308 family)